jgi:hypothetical protein
VNEIIEVEDSAAQGDVLFLRVDELPEGIKLAEETSRAIVAHSETGHHHVAVASKVRFFTTTDPLVSYIESDDDIDVVHEREFDTHKTVRLVAKSKKDKGDTKKPAKKNRWKVKRQREATPDSFRQVAD